MVSIPMVAIAIATIIETAPQKNKDSRYAITTEQHCNGIRRGNTTDSPYRIRQTGATEFGLCRPDLRDIHCRGIANVHIDESNQEETNQRYEQHTGLQ